MTKEKLWDVVIYENESRKVESVIGKGMQRDRGFYNAEKRLESAFMRINHNYNAAIVSAGVYSVASIVSEQHA